MTCIVAARDKDRIVLGSDTQSTGGWVKYRCLNPKVFRVRDMMIGGTTSWRMLQILQYHLDSITLSEPATDPLAWTVKTFIPRARAVFNEHGFMSKDDNRDVGGVFIVAKAGRIICIQNDWAALEWEQPFAAIGSGEQCAVGAMHHANAAGLDAMKVAQAGLSAAAFAAVGVQGPFEFLEENLA